MHTLCQKEVIHNFKNQVLVTWPATDFLILSKWYGFEKNYIILFIKRWPTNIVSKAKSYDFPFHKNDVTWPRESGLYKCQKWLNPFKTIDQSIWKLIRRTIDHRTTMSLNKSSVTPLNYKKEPLQNASICPPFNTICSLTVYFYVQHRRYFLFIILGC